MLSTYYTGHLKEENAETDAVHANGSGNKIWHGALLMSDGTDEAIRNSGAGKIMGIAKTTTEEASEIIPVITKNHFRGFTIAGTPKPLAYVYCASDDLADITTVSTTAAKIGYITGLNKDGVTWDWVFAKSLSAA
jgi:hypothetical protein